MVDAAFNGVGGEKPVTPGTAKSNANRKLEEHEVTVEIDTNGNGDETKSSKELENHDKQPDPSVPYWKLYMFADKLDVLLIILGILGAIGNGVSQPVMTILFGQIINSFGSNQTDTRKMIDEVSKVALRFVYLGIASGAASYLQISCWICAGERQSARIRSLYLKQIMRQDVVFFDMDTTTGEVVARMSGDTVLIADAVGEKAGKFIMGIATFFGGYAIAFSRNWKLTLVMLSAIPLMIGAGGIMSMQISTMSTRAQESYAAAGSLVEQVVGAMRTVSSFTGENKAVEEYDKALMSAEKEGSRQGWVTGLGFGVLIGLVFASYSLALWYGGQLVVNEGANGGEVLNVIFAVLTGGLAMGQTSPSISAFALGRAAAYKMFQVIDRVPEIDVYDKSGIIPDNVKADIEFRNVQFHYPTRPDYQIFSNFSLSIPSGKTIALVGESGSGKSTVISLIERFYDPQGGAVLLDKVNIKDLQLKWLRQQIALVSQEPVLFSASIKDNIGYGKDGATFAEIQSAAALANAAKFISKIPKEYETLVGERGVQLSGGQKQRIAIARAILRNPQILLLDEATSALDAQSEHLVQDALDRIMVDRTTVVVAHRLTTVRNADLIAVLQRGAIVETGSHDELVRSPNGAYSQLIRLQEISGAQAGSEAVNEVDPDDIPEKNSVIDSLTKSSSQKAVLESSSSKGGSYRRSFSLLRSHPIGKIADNLQGDLDKDSLSRTVGDIESTHQEGLQKDMSIFRLATLNKPEIPWFIAGSVAAACSGLTFPVFGLLLSSAINAFYEPPGKLRKDINFWAFMFLIMAIGVLAVSPVQMGSFAIIGNRLVRRVRRLTYEKILQQEIGWFDEGVNSSGALGARLAGDATSIKSLVADSLALLVQNIASIASGLIIAFTGSWQLSLVVLAILPVLSLQGFYNMKAMNGFNTKAKEQYEEASKVANDAVSSMRTVASFSAEEKVCELYDMRCVLPVKTGIRQGLISGTALAVANFGMFACNGLCFWVGGKLVDRGETTFKDVFRTFFAVTLSTIGIAQAAGLAPDVSKVKSAVKSIFSIVDRDSKIDPTNMNGLTLKMVKGDIVLDHVEFRYPTRLDFPIFKDFSLSVEAGKTVAIVGESGSGKSTVISLIERFYDPISGKVLLDGKDIKSLQLKWYRQQIGLVSQEPVLFNETIRWNITYGKEGGVTQHEIQTVAESANAHKFITGFPDGYETRVGERGVQLSGGQKQRVAIARAILKNPRVLLLDEATSALDAESEHVVQEALDRVMVNRTTVVVAHRLSTIRNADLIAVVQGGVIVEQGTHNDLLERGTGAYAALVRLHMNSDS